MIKQYTEDISVSEPVRRRYVEGIDALVERMRAEADRRREAYVTPEKMAHAREVYRNEYRRLLGLDILCEVFGAGAPRYESTFVGEDDLCRIERLVLTIEGDICFTGLLLTPHKRKAKAPAVIMSHGGGGSPELCCDLIGHNNYSGIVRKLLSRGCVVFAHQLLQWNLAAKLCEVSKIPMYTTHYDRAKTDVELKHCGVGITSFEIYAITRAIDLLLAREDIDAERCGMLGLSYGGFYTLYTMAHETRIKVGWSAACFNDRMKYAWNDMVWSNSAARFLDPEVAGLCAPRRLICDVGRTDTVFTYDTAEKLFPHTQVYFDAAGVSKQLTLNLWEGEHRFDLNNFEAFVGELGV